MMSISVVSVRGILYYSEYLYLCSYQISRSLHYMGIIVVVVNRTVRDYDTND